MRRTVLLAVTLLALVAVSAHAAFPGHNGAVMYGKWVEQVPSAESAGEQSFQLEWQTSDGDTGTLVDCGDCRQWLSPSVSPDGETIAFALDGRLELVELDGSNRRQIPLGSGRADYPAFSPTGRQVVFAATTGIAVVGIDGSKRYRLARGGTSPAWSTRGWIAFVRNHGLYRVRPDGRGLRLLIRDGELPTWAPDGTRVAFSRCAHRRGPLRCRGVYVAHADGSHIRRLAGGAASMRAWDISWSPDGRRLLVSRDAEGLSVIDLRGVVRRTLQLDGGDIVTPMGVDWQAQPR